MTMTKRSSGCVTTARNRAIGVALATALAAGCGRANSGSSAGAPAAPVETRPVYGAFGLDLTAGNPAVKPGDDFFAYANGAWHDTFTIPADKASYGMFSKLDDEARAHVRMIIEGAAASKPAPGSIERKIGDYFASFMNTAKLEADGIDAIKPDLDRIAAAKTPADLSRLFGEPGFQSPIGAYIGPDDKDPDAYFVNLAQSGLGMPDRDYYLKDDPRLKEARAAYVAHVERLLTLAGVPDAKVGSARVMALETKIAQAHWAAERTRDAIANYNPKSRAEVKTFAPGLDWQAMFDAMKVGTWNRFNVNTPTALKDIAVLVTSQPLEAWKAYLTYHHLHAHAPYLPRTIDDENFAFYGKVLSGRAKQRERWERGVDVVNRGLGEAIGQVYVKQHFPPESKTKIDALVENLKLAYKANLEKLEWMGPETRAKALEKLATFRVKIGYPARWKDYSSMTIGDDLLANVRAADLWAWQFDVDKLDKPVDKDEWLMTPQTVNAYYFPGTNEITFPAAILQPPFFDPHADDAVNYGGIGAVIGHEIGHAFDDQGRLYDATGKLKDWWTRSDDAAFRKRSSALSAQFAAFEVLPGLKVNGALTLGENIGDLGGLGVAYRAYRQSLGGKDAPVIGGLTGDQRFFLSYGQIWRSKYRDEELRSLVLSNSHAPPLTRVNGAVRNVDAWYAAFNVQPGDKLYLPPDQRVRIWQ
jgi:predicted metalloendopeptidase